MEQNVYIAEDGKTYPADFVATSSNAEFLATMHPDTRTFFEAHPPGLLDSFRQHALGNHAESRRLNKEATAALAAMGPDAVKRSEEITEKLVIDRSMRNPDATKLLILIKALESLSDLLSEMKKVQKTPAA